MFKEIFVFLLLAHLIGDFYVQTKKMAEKKETKLKWVAFHGLSYWLTALILAVPVWSFRLFVFSTLAAVLHFVIDAAKYFYTAKLKQSNRLSTAKDRNLFFGDQLLHFTCIVLTAFAFSLWQGGEVHPLSWAAQFLTVTGVPGFLSVVWAAALLAIHKPANIAIVKLLTLYKPDDSAETAPDRAQDKNAGRFIGTVERMIILIFIALGQYAAIGLVLTAKSIARYDRISKEPYFAEYYLLGTLISTLAVIVVSFLFRMQG